MAVHRNLCCGPPTAANGLAGRSLAGTKLYLRQSSLKFRPSNYRGGAVVAKYGDKSVYFDLDDIGNTTGQRDLYGCDAPSPYNSLQSKFFETFAAPFTKRGLLLKFLILGGGTTLAFVSSQAIGDVLPIVKVLNFLPNPGSLASHRCIFFYLLSCLMYCVNNLSLVYGIPSYFTLLFIGESFD